MKKKFLHITLPALCMATVLPCCLSCASDYLPGRSSSSEAIVLAASTDNAGGTRAATDIQGTSFYEKEVINVYITDAATGSYIGGSPARYRTEEPSDNINPLTPLGEQPYFPNGAMDEVKINVRAMYPQSVRQNENPTENPTVSFTVRPDQTDSANYKASDLMFASVQGHGKGDGTAMLRFQHKMAKMVVTAAGQDGIRVKGIRLVGMNSTVNFNTNDGSTVTVDGTKPDIRLENGGAALIPPQDIQGIFITVDVERDLADGSVETKEAQFNLGTAKTLEAGKQYNVNVAIGAQNLTGPANITSWPASVGTISVAAAGSVGFYITGVTDMVYSRDSVKQPGIKVYTSYDEETNTYSNELHAGDDYTLQYFNNLNRGTASVLVLGAGTYTGLASVKSFEIAQSPCALKYPQSSMTLDFAYESVVDNKLKIVHGGTGGTEYDWTATDGTLTFEYDSNVVHVDEYGNVTMRGVGTTTIKATLNGDGNYQSATAQYTLNIQNKELKDPLTDNTSTISIEMPASYEYTGSPLQSTFEAGGETGLVVKDGNATLIRGTHYTLEYSDNLTNVGTVTVTIKGTGDYTGSITRKFQITQATPTLDFDETPVILDVSHDNRNHVNGTFSTSQYLFNSSVTRLASATYGNNTALTPTLSISGNTSLVSFNSSTGVVSANQVTSSQSANTDAYKNYQKGTVTVTATAGDGTNVKKVSKSYTITLVQTVWDFYFHGEASEAAANSYFQNTSTAVNQTVEGAIVPWTAKATGTYGLEAWGAQGGGYGGHSDRYGGVGGYARGNVSLENNNQLYVVCGGGGRWRLVGATPDNNRSNGNAGGYNGGGKGGAGTSYYHAGGGGGGATHIAKVTGLLPTIRSGGGGSDNLYIVAGGGGGNSNSRDAGIGGGETGGPGSDFTAANTLSGVIPGGTQSTGNAAGQGGDGMSSTSASGEPSTTPTATEAGQQNRGSGGGGGGYWGGYAKKSSGNTWTPFNASTYAGGGGGSGYFNPDLIIHGTGKLEQGGGFSETPANASSGSPTVTVSANYSSPTGQGHARITLLTVPTSTSSTRTR